jgi:ribosomal protein S18 acetylase RimI-like enzyme
MVRLAPMSAAESELYLETVVRSFAEQNIQAGRWTSQDGLAEARKEFQRILPAGRETPNHFLFHIVPDGGGARVGWLWLAIEPRGGFVYDLEIEEAFRRRGYAEEAMRLAETVAREHGADKISLHVFATNSGARRLYVKLGYVETNLMMSKGLSSSPVGPSAGSSP